MKKQTSQPVSILWLVPIGVLLAWGAVSCSGPSGAQVFLYINNDTGCDVVATLDGGSPVTNTASGGPYTLFTNIASGQHAIGIKGPLNTSSCNYDISGENHNITVDNPCSAVNGTSGYLLYCN